MHLQVGGGGDGAALAVVDPAGVLAAVLRGAVGQGQREVVLLGHDLDPVGQLVRQRLVVLEPGRRQTGQCSVGGAAKQGILAR